MGQYSELNYVIFLTDVSVYWTGSGTRGQILLKIYFPKIFIEKSVLEYLVKRLKMNIFSS